MHDLDTILSVVENPTRRKILKALVREPHYPLQLSRELGMSQQAIMKNLDILEKSGLVESWRENSDKGPEKTVYRPTSEFTLTIDMRNGMFRTSLVSLEDDEIQNESNEMELREIRESLSEIDRNIKEFEEMRAAMIRRRNMMISAFMSGYATEGLDYVGRSLLYEMLNSPDNDIGDVSKNLGLREDRTTEIVDDIENKCRDAKGRNDR